ncbi:PSD1 and planctomycete cytochrome C domain-containing protein [Flagellimonas flava]|uniref:PSD1 and planctomycete cytochrome C domain-containing protein n=1 Tax=Flagellimonas flava TaxID=570519 RepID=UPI003D654209
MKTQNFIGVLLLLAICTSCRDSASDYGSVADKKMPKVIDYNFDIRPILSDKCFACHGPDANKREADLRLDTKEGAYAALKDHANKYAIVSGKPEESEVYLRITSPDSTQLMPPLETNLKLNDHELKLIKKWIEQGAEYKRHWAFTAPILPEKPAVKNGEWPTSDLDFFVLKKIEELGLKPNERADKARLLKRLSFDLIGLPPTLEMQDEFLNDNSVDAYEKMVDQLLSNKHYGEKMAVHWLDIARYADSHGYQDDGLRTMWPWRDWVIHAFNENYSFDTFLTWQLAGDLLPEKNIEAILATGFNRNHKITQEGGVIDEEYRIEYVTDRTNTFGKAFLGLTFECAKCHDHKYDPISQKDYYSTFAFFDKVPEKGLYGTIDASFADPPNMKITNKLIDSVLSFVNNKSPYPVDVMVMKDSVGIRTTHILDRGVYDAKGEEVSFDTPESILAFDTEKYNQNRLGLTQWLLSPEHPLTSRVFVNRIWQEFFGKGIVRTSGDFGMQGDLPTHPELLDWLAVDFQKDWDVKRLVKNIVMSSTYTQSTVVSNKKLRKDPENKFYSRMSRLRLNAEMSRDMVLASSGLLNTEIGGESVKPYQPEGIWEQATSGRGLLQEYIQDHNEAIYRRGMYTFIKRTVPPPTMLTFDASNRDQCEVRRLTTSTPLQALIILNDPTVLESARVLSEKLSGQELTDDEKVTTAFRSIVCRMPKNEEQELLVDYLKEQREHFTKNPALAEEFINVGEYPAQKNRDAINVASLMQVIHTMYNLEETMTRS